MVSLLSYSRKAVLILCWVVWRQASCRNWGLRRFNIGLRKGPSSPDLRAQDSDRLTQNHQAIMSVVRVVSHIRVPGQGCERERKSSPYSSHRAVGSAMDYVHPEEHKHLLVTQVLSFAKTCNHEAVCTEWTPISNSQKDLRGLQNTSLTSWVSEWEESSARKPSFVPHSSSGQLSHVVCSETPWVKSWLPTS